MIRRAIIIRPDQKLIQWWVATLKVTMNGETFHIDAPILDNINKVKAKRKALADAKKSWPTAEIEVTKIQQHRRVA